MNASVDPRLVAAACVPSCEDSLDRQLGQSIDLFCLVTGGKCQIERGPERIQLEANTLILVRAGEGRLLRRRQRSSPALWLVYFQASRRLYERLPVLAEADPVKRVWKLTDSEVESFKDLFVKLTVERAREQADARHAEAGWLSLLMVSVQRWKGPVNGQAERGPPSSWKIPEPPFGSDEPKDLAGHESLDSEVLRRRIKFLSRGN
jgi:hypothetical protein